MEVVKVKFYLLGVLIFVSLGVLVFTDLSTFLQLENIRYSIATYGMWAPLIFLGLYIVLNSFFIPAAPLTWVSGVLFGPFIGAVLNVTGGVIGSIIAFFVSRSLGSGYVRQILEKKYKIILMVDKQISKHGLFSVFALRFVPIFPFNGVNLFMGMTRVKFIYFFLGTFLGTVPGSLAYAVLGDGVIMLDINKIVAALFLFLGLIVIGHLMKRKYFMPSAT